MTSLAVRHGSHDVEYLDDGRILVDGELPLLDGLALDDLQTEVRLMGAIVADKAKRYGYPYRAAMATLHAEGVIPVARNKRIAPENAWSIVSFDGGLGHFQITSEGLKKDAAGNELTDEEVLEPETNADIGVRFLAHLRDRFGIAESAEVFDLARVAAAYNAGSPRPGKNAWNLHTFNPDYIDRTIAANNSIVTMFPEEPTGPNRARMVIRRLLRFFGFAALAGALGWATYEASR